MRITRPTPAMVVAIIALIVACAGTATAAGIVLIKSSAQVKAGALNGSDLKSKTLTNRNLADGAVNGRTIKNGTVGSEDLSSGVKSALAAQGFTGTESVRRDGPTVSNGGSQKVATLTGLAPGTYALFAKTVISPTNPSGGLLGELLKNNKNGSARCTLDGAGDSDEAVVPIGAPFALYANTLNLQLTRTLSAASDIVLTCDANVAWKAGNTSIVALKLAGSTRVDSVQR
jgi:hypothetical protein